MNELNINGILYKPVNPDVAQIIIDSAQEEEYKTPQYFQDELRRLGAGDELMTFINKNFFPRKAVTETLERIKIIQQLSSDHYGLVFNDEVQLINMLTRRREVVEARQISMRLCKKFTKGTLAIIGKQHGGKDHSTVLHAIRIVSNLIDTDKSFKESYNIIYRDVKAVFGKEVKRDDDGRW